MSSCTLSEYHRFHALLFVFGGLNLLEDDINNVGSASVGTRKEIDRQILRFRLTDQSIRKWSIVTYRRKAHSVIRSDCLQEIANCQSHLGNWFHFAYCEMHNIHFPGQSSVESSTIPSSFSVNFHPSSEWSKAILASGKRVFCSRTMRRVISKCQLQSEII